MSGASETAPVREEKARGDSGTESGWKTVLFNCDCHSFEQVESQLIKAVHCTLTQARRYAMEVHTKGSAVVYRGPRERCEAVAMTIEEIGLLAKACQ